MSAGSRQTFAATLPQDRFYCLLDELALHLIPRPALRDLRNDSGDSSLFLNPECEILPGTQPPVEFTDELLSGFALQGTIAWVREPATGNLLPFWLGPELERIVRGLRVDDAAPPLKPEVRAVLLAAGILCAADRNARHARVRESAITTAASLFQERGYAPISGLIHPFHVAALRRYYRHRIRTGAIPLGDRQSPRRYAAYNEPVARFFHHQIARTFVEIAGTSLRPSYVYLASYLSGAELKKHTDREQCEFSLTFCLDYSPEPELATPWPIRLDTPTGTVTVYQALGDGLAYRGTRLPHYRGPLGGSQTSTSIFLHYVGADFKGSLA